jgi:hypothetical protein
VLILGTTFGFGLVHRALIFLVHFALSILYFSRPKKDIADELKRRQSEKLSYTARSHSQEHLEELFMVSTKVLCFAFVHLTRRAIALQL